MKRKHKKKIKKYIITVACLLIAVACVSNLWVLKKPIKFIGDTLAVPVLKAVLQTKSPSPDNFENSTEQTQSPTTVTPTTAQKTTKSASISVSSSEVKGRVLSQTIDKSGATDSLGDVYIKNKTAKVISLEKALSNSPKFKIKLNSKKPQVLIVHTHATESFFDTQKEYYTQKDMDNQRSEDCAKNMVALGEIVAKKLNDAGINTVHSRVLHDAESYTGSYDRSRETIQSYLKKHPSIKVVFDLHRDAITEEDGDKICPIIDINDKTAGQIMLVCGCESGPITGYPNWQKNLRFSLQLQKALETTYPSLARPLLFTEKKYNQDLCAQSVLIEIGSDSNTLSQVKHSSRLLSNVLIKFLKNYS